MKKENLFYFLFCIISIMSCSKQDTETIKPDYKKITIVRTNSGGYSGEADSLIIELNNNSTIKSIKTYAFIVKIISSQIIKDFIYEPNSTLLDSSIIATKNWMRITDIFPEKYQYENGKIVTVYSPVFEIGGSNKLVAYSYNQEGKIINKFTTYKYREDSVRQNLKFEYNGNNLYSAFGNFSSPMQQPYTNKYINFDDKINPLNELFKKCNFPLDQEITNLFPPEYFYSENNPTKMEVNYSSINQTYKYNQFNYPIEIISNWDAYNVRIYYE